MQEVAPDTEGAGEEDPGEEGGDPGKEGESLGFTAAEGPAPGEKGEEEKHRPESGESLAGVNPVIQLLLHGEVVAEIPLARLQGIHEVAEVESGRADTP